MIDSLACLNAAMNVQSEIDQMRKEGSCQGLSRKEQVEKITGTKSWQDAMFWCGPIFELSSRGFHPGGEVSPELLMQDSLNYMNR